MSCFEQDLVDLFEDEICDDEEFAKRVYAALTNIIWRQDNTDYEHAITFRGAGGLIADIRGEGHYMDWYCSAGEGVVDKNILDALLTRGWTPHKYH